MSSTSCAHRLRTSKSLRAYNSDFGISRWIDASSQARLTNYCVLNAPLNLFDTESLRAWALTFSCLSPVESLTNHTPPCVMAPRYHWTTPTTPRGSIVTGRVLNLAPSTAHRTIFLSGVETTNQGLAVTGRVAVTAATSRINQSMVSKCSLFVTAEKSLDEVYHCTCKHERRTKSSVCVSVICVVNNFTQQYCSISPRRD